MNNLDDRHRACTITPPQASIMGYSRNSYQYNNFQPKVDSNPIAPRVRRKRQRLPA